MTSTNTHTKSIYWITVLIAPILGLLAFILPKAIIEMDIPFVGPDSLPLRWEFWGIYKRVILIPTVLGLIIVGYILGRLNPRLWLPNSILTIALFPLLTVYELFIEPNRHPFLPIEILSHLFFALCAMLGAFIGSKRTKGSTAKGVGDK